VTRIVIVSPAPSLADGAAAALQGVAADGVNTRWAAEVVSPHGLKP
jgi:hypothetical protein